MARTRPPRPRMVGWKRIVSRGRMRSKQNLGLTDIRRLPDQWSLVSGTNDITKANAETHARSRGINDWVGVGRADWSIGGC
jgi:hypothetical protein